MSEFLSQGFVQENVFYDFLERKKAFLGYNNKKLKSRKFNIFSNPWFWSKNGHFSNFFLLGNVGHENDFCDLLERKIAFLGYKNKKFKSWKIDIFPNEWTHGFGPKTAIFPAFFFTQYRPGKWLLRYSKPKKRLCRL